MSTLRCTNLQDTSGGNSLTTAQIYNGAAKAWVNFNGTSTVAIRAQFNVSSITDNGVGSYTVNYSSALTDANYVCVVAASNANDSVNLNPPAGVDRSSSSVRIDIETAGGTPQFDADLIDVAIFR